MSRSCQIHAEFRAKNKRSIFPFLRKKKRTLLIKSIIGKVRETLHHRYLMWISMNGNQGQTFHFARISVKNMHIFFWTADSKRRNTFYIYGNYFYWWWAMASFMWMVFSENQRDFISFIYHTIKAASARESICIDKCLLWKSEFVCQNFLTPQGGEWMYLIQALSIQVSKKLFISDAALFSGIFDPLLPLSQ